MDHAETAKLLGYVISLDRRTYVEGDAATGQLSAWARMLRHADVNDAVSIVERYYRNPDNKYPITINEIAGGCRPLPKWEGKQQHQLEVGKAVPMPEEVRAVIGRSGPDRRARGRDCPWEACKARAGNPCTSAGDAVSWMHPSRYGDEDEAVRKAKWAASQEDAA